MKNLGQFKNRKGGKESASTRKQWKTRTKTKFVHESMRSYQRTKELESQPKGKHRDFLDYFRFTTLKPIFAFFLWKCSAYRASSGCVVVAAADAPWKRPDCFHTISMTTVHSNPFSMHGTTTTWYLYSSAQLRNVHDCLHPRKNLRIWKVICWPHRLQLPSAQVPCWTASYNVNKIQRYLTTIRIYTTSIRMITWQSLDT